MQQNNMSAGNTRLASFLNNPIAQATVTGALTLIPARTYPTWLRRGLIWAPVVVGFAGATYFVANPKTGLKSRDPRQNTGRADLDYLPATPVSDGQRARRSATIIAVGGGIGAVVSLTTAAGFWADEKIEQGLRRFKVPFPRAVMGAAAGAITWGQTKQNAHQGQHGS